MLHSFITFLPILRSSRSKAIDFHHEETSQPRSPHPTPLHRHDVSRGKIDMLSSPY